MNVVICDSLVGWDILWVCNLFADPQDYILDRYEDMVTIDMVTPYSPAALVNIKKVDKGTCVLPVYVASADSDTNLVCVTCDHY